MRKIQKAELKRDLLKEMAVRVRHFIVEHKVQIYIGIVGFVVLIVALYLYVESYRKKTEAANHLFEKVFLAYSEVRKEKVEFKENLRQAIAGFDPVVKNYPNFTTGKRALFYQGEGLYRIGDYRGAMDKFRQLLDGDRRFYLAPNALESIGKCLEQLGDYQAAIDAYGSIEQDYPDSYLLVSSLIDIARCYDAMGDYGKSLEYYRRVKSEQRDSQWHPFAEERILWIEANHPVEEVNVEEK